MTRFSVLLLIGGWLLASVPSAHGARGVEEFDGFRLTEFELRGVPGEVKKELENGLALAEDAKFFKRSTLVFSAKVLEEDRQRTLLFLARKGYPHAEVSARVEPKPGRRVKATLQIEPGPPVVIHAFALEGIPPGLDKKVRKAVPTRTGEIFVDSEIERAARAAEAALRDGGYALAKVRPRVDPVDSVRVEVRLVAEPGSRYVFGQTRVSGLEDDLVPLAIRSMDLPPGSPYSPEAIKNAQDNLRLLDLFRQVRLTTAPAGPESLDIVAELSSREPHTVEVRGGYMSEDLFRARFRWAGHNTFKSGRGLETSLSYSQFYRELRVSTWWPALFGPRTREVVTLRALFEEEDAYSQRGADAEFASWYRRSFRTTYRLYAQFGYVIADFTSEYEDDFEGLMTVLGASWTRDTSDDRLRPTRGLVMWAEAKYSPKFLPAEAPFVLGEAGVSLYFPFPGRTVLAQHCGLGLADPLDDEKGLLPGTRFYAGGINSNRGFERRKLGPLFPDGDPAGGEAKIESLTEFRFPIVWKFRGAAFLDVGQVWERIDAMVLEELQPSAGWALMIDTPVGPVRVDMGYRLRDSGDQPAQVFHFLIGNPF